jgi:hypothetical protein
MSTASACGVTSSQFTELPLTLGGGIRNPSSFIFLQPGVSHTGTWEKHINGNPAFTDQVYTRPNTRTR